MQILADVGTVEIDGQEIGLTRGGVQFVVERDYRDAVADGDYGPVKGRKRINTQVARMTINMLEIDPTMMHLLYQGTVVTTTNGNTEITGKVQVDDDDYVTVTFTGTTNKGEDVIITLDNAINTANIDWNFVDKDEVVPQLVYEAAYDPANRKASPWKIVFVGEGE